MPHSISADHYTILWSLPHFTLLVRVKTQIRGVVIPQRQRNVLLALLRAEHEERGIRYHLQPCPFPTVFVIKQNARISFLWGKTKFQPIGTFAIVERYPWYIILDFELGADLSVIVA